MRLKRKIITLVILLISVSLISFCFHQFPVIVPLYSHYIFVPYQWLRGLLFGYLPFSLGDILYYLLVLWVIYTVVKWLKLLLNFRRDKERLVVSLLKMITTLVFGYLLFFLGWGGNYNKPPLGKTWGLENLNTARKILQGGNQQISEKNDLIAFDTFLINQLNTYAPHFNALPVKELNTRACEYYRLYTDTRLKQYGLGIKPTLLGWLLDGIDLDGYYNPFTGEGQYYNKQPAYSMPELFTHEIAHQAGIAAEGDANLLSYAVCTASGDSSFCYSAYLNAWQLTNERLSLIDSGLASNLEQQLNKLTRAQLDVIDQLSKKDDNETGYFFNKLFDGFLKTQSQKDGLDDYAGIAITAWQLEQKRAKRPLVIIRVP